MQESLDKAAWFRSRKIDPITKAQDERFNANMERQAQHFEAEAQAVVDQAAALIAAADGLHAAALTAQAEAAAAEAASIAARTLANQLRAAAEAALAEVAVLEPQRLALLAQVDAWTVEAESLETTAATQMALWSEALLEAQAQSALAAQLRLDAEAAYALASIEADAAHAAGLAAQARAVLEEQAAIAAQQLAQTYRSEQQQAADESAVQSQLAAEVQAEADRYAALAADPPSTYTETLFAYDLAGHLIGEYHADGTALREYVWLEDQPLALLRPGSGLLGGTEAFYYHVDQLNTPQTLTDATGQVVWAGIQQPFGEVEVTIAEVEQNLRFPGQQYDAETGLHYNYFRDYDPGLGRYRESDPIGLAGGPNTFAYVDGAPLSYADSTGEFANALIGGTSGVAAGYLIAQLTGDECYSMDDAILDFVAGSVGGGLISKLNKLNRLRTLRNTGESMGMTYQGTRNTVETWRGTGVQRLRIKHSPSLNAPHPGSSVPRAELRIGEGEYLDPFTGAVGGKGPISHLPLEPISPGMAGAAGALSGASTPSTCGCE